MLEVETSHSKSMVVASIIFRFVKDINLKTLKMKAPKLVRELMSLIQHKKKSKNAQGWFSGAPNQFRINPNVYYATVTAVLIIIVAIIDFLAPQFIGNNTDVKNVWLNLHASVVEVFLLGLFISKFNDITKKQRNIEEWIRQIDDYREWQEPEAAYRIKGLIKRLLDNGVNNLNLDYCYLKKTDLSGYNLRNCYLFRAKLNDSILLGTNLIEANLSEADLSNAFLVNAYFIETNLTGVQLNGAIVDGPEWINNLKQRKCKGVDEIEKHYFISEESIDSQSEGTKNTKYTLVRQLLL